MLHRATCSLVSTARTYLREVGGSVEQLLYKFIASTKTVKK